MHDTNQTHANRLLDDIARLGPCIRDHADEAERGRRLPPIVVSALAEAGVFHMLTPLRLGGLEVDPLSFYRVVEAIARIDGSTGWCAWS